MERITINFANNGLQANMILSDDPTITLSDIAVEIQNSGITYGIKSARIRGALEQRIPGQKILIAEGKAPENGIDGFVECLVDMTAEPQSVVEDKTVNYFPVWITNVHTGQKLLKITQPTPGVNGIDVRGFEIPAKPGKSVRSIKGFNTSFSETNENYLIAEKSGNFTWDGNRAEVNPEYKIAGDLGLMNGNIEFVGSLLISGNIKSGVNIKVDGNIEVWGSVEDANIEAGGSINIRGGFIGFGRGKIKAEGDVRVSHISNQTIFTLGNIYIQREAVNTNLTATKIFAQTASIFGGSLIIQDEIHVYSLGRPVHNTTKVLVGNKSIKMEIIRNMEKDLREKEAIYYKNKEDVYNLVVKKMNVGKLSQEEEEELNTKKRELDTLPHELADLQEERDKLYNNLQETTVPKIIIYGSIYPNVVCTINDVTIEIQAEESSMTFFEKGGVILKQRGTSSHIR